MIYSLNEVVHLHLEISSLCNASCPKCPRNFHGMDHNAGYVEHNMTLKEAKKIFSESFVRQLKKILINGNFGDAVMNSETPEILAWFKTVNPNVHINVSTNGGARNANFWKRLANLNIEVFFCIDGLEDTNHLYRQNVMYHTVLKNAKTFINAGGNAGWKFIKFEHNQHQIEEAKERSKHMGFNHFFLVDDGRDTGPVYNSKGEFVHMLGPTKWEGPANTTLKWMQSFELTFVENYKITKQDIEVRPINCEVKKTKSLYVSSTGDIYPCCYLGFSPKTYSQNTWLGWANAQVAPLIQENNAIEYDLEHCIAWFNKVEAAWSKSSVEEGYLSQCNNACGNSAIDKSKTYHVLDSKLIANNSSIPI